MFTEEFKNLVVRLAVIILVVSVGVLAYIQIQLQRLLPREVALTNQAIMIAGESEKKLHNVLLSLTPTPTASPTAKITVPLFFKPTIKPLAK